MLHNYIKKSCLTPLILFATICATAQEKDSVKTPSARRFNIHFQTTYIYQYKPAFDAKYTGPNSLLPTEEKQNSITGTLYLGARLWKGAELYINPEIAGGSGLSGAFGLAASTNGETFRVGNPEPTLYLARGYVSQTFRLGIAGKQIEETANELGGAKPLNYLKLFLGKMCLGDIFDINAYANSPRTQFMNWCLMNNGAWDYAANTRGYTYAFAAMLQNNSMTYRAALATLPVVANGPDLNTNLNEEYSINAEVDKGYMVNKKRAGNVRILGYYNSGHMGNYDNALKNKPVGDVPDITRVRRYGNSKTGVSINADQELANNLGIFARIGWNDGKNETWAFTEADRHISAGISVDGATWKRNDDNLSIGLLANGLSADHRDYLAAGGKGFQLGDGALNYSNEIGAELFYSFKPAPAGIWLTADYQFIINPGYNKDRGPLSVFSCRVHVEL